MKKILAKTALMLGAIYLTTKICDRASQKISSKILEKRQSKKLEAIEVEYFVQDEDSKKY